MSSVRYYVTLVASLLALLCLAIAPSAGRGGARDGPAAGIQATSLQAPQTPLHARLVIASLPGLQQKTTLTCRITADLAAAGVAAQIELPANVAVHAGSLTWQGDLAAGQTAEFAATVAFTAPGDTALHCRVSYRLDAANSWGDLASLYLSVGAGAARVGFEPIPPQARLHNGGLQRPGDGQYLSETAAYPDPARITPPPPAINPLPPPAAPAAPPAASQPGRNPKDQAQAPAADDPAQPALPITSAASGDVPNSLTVTGNWAYHDRDNNYVGALEMLVELVRGDNYEHLAWCFTDLSGDYSCGPVSNPGGPGVRTMIHSWSNYNPNPDTLAVVNPDWGTTNAIGNTFRTQTGVAVFPDGTHDIGAWYVFDNDPYERAYWTQRDLNDTWRFIAFVGGGGYAGPTTVQWKIDSVDGTYYNPGGNVHLAGVDPLSPLGVVAKHEYSHNIMYNIYGNYMPPNPNCNPHTIPGSTSQGCAWTEGWAEFIPAAVNNDPTFYWPSGSSLNLELPTWGSFGWNNGDTVEGRVAGALWDIYDAQNDGDDIYYDGTFTNLWEVSYNANDNVMSDFWADWVGRGHSNVSWGPIMDLYQNTINYRNGPFNDDFSGYWSIGSVPFYYSGWNTTGATTQGFDPMTACASATYPRQSRSVWYAYTPPLTGSYHIATVGSSYDTVLSVWTGSWGFLTSQACDDDSGGNWTSALDVVMIGGVTYYIEAMAYGAGSGGLLDLSMTLNPPVNDDYDFAFWTYDGYGDYENTTNATIAFDDPSFACGPFFNGQGAHTVWYFIGSPFHRVMTVNTLTSSYDTVLGVFTGSRGTLSLAACSDDWSGTFQSQTQVALTPGVSYHIEALGYNASNFGALNLAVSLGPVCPDFVAPAGVGIEDISLIAGLWGQVQGPPYDYDDDSLITIYDISQVTPMWGQNCLAVENPTETPTEPGLKAAPGLE